MSGKIKHLCASHKGYKDQLTAKRTKYKGIYPLARFVGA